MTGTTILSTAIRTSRQYMPFGRWGWLFTGFAVTGLGLSLNWGWFVANGLAPLILALAPCAVMCAVGACAMGGGKKCADKGDVAALPKD